MPLNPGTRLGPYEIVAPLGAGGMGEVYKARDTRLERTVAVKILSPSVSAAPEFRQRFDREARVVSQLNHPHICALFDVGDQDGTAFLVMEYVEGETLAQRLKKGPLPVEQALRLAGEIADALDKAHRHGTVHRDLKPGNVMLTKAGAKLLDFGLARTGVAQGSGVMETRLVSTPASPAQSSPLTAQGTILGTFQYMSPEQIEGGEADARSDIWAFGCVLYEMISGRPAFQGKSQASLIAAILEREPTPITELQPVTPPALGRLIRTCLAKNPDDRFQTAHDLGLQLAWIDEGGSAAGAPAPVLARRKRRERGAWIGVALAASIVAAAAAWWSKPAPHERRIITRFTYQLPQGQVFTRTGRHDVALSPDGALLAYIANQQIYLRRMDQLEAQPLRGTDEDPLELVFSPDGQWIAYFAPVTSGGTAAFSLKKIAVTGGASVRLCGTEFPFGVTWRENTIVFGQAIGGKGFVQAIADTGGTPRTLLSRDQVIAQPQMLEDGKHVLYSVRPSESTSWEDGQIVVQAPGAQPRVILSGAADGRLLPTNHLIYVHEGSLFGIAFDRERLQTVGGPVPVVEGVRAVTSGIPGTNPGPGQFGVSANGTLAYISGNIALARTLVWVDRYGAEQAIAAPARAYRYPRISPDGARIAVDIDDEEKDIWIWEIARQQLRRLTFGPGIDFCPVWTPDGHSIVYSEGSGGTSFDVFRAAVDTTGGVERLTNTPTIKLVSSLSPRGDVLIYREGPPGTDQNLFALTLGGPQPPQPVVRTTFVEANGEISPDGRWIAYDSNESGRREVYVRPFPSVDAGRWQVSTKGGARPAWSQKGREIVYVSADGPKLVAVPVLPTPPGGPFSVGDAKPLFGLNPYYGGAFEGSSGRSFDVSADGQRVLMIKLPQTENRQSVIVVSNWVDELKARVPTR
jgi:eukaryotic-like serine/threonine-protein kinase